MDFQTAVKKGFENIGNLEGRASRPEFWWFVLAVWVVELILVMLTNLIFRGFLGSVILFVVWVVAFLAIVSVGVRRLHDVGQSGWLVILWFIPCIFLVPLFFAVQPGQPSDNAYGPPPTA